MQTLLNMILDKKNSIIALVICISIIISYFYYHTNKEYSNYKLTEAKIVQIHAPKLTKHGVIPTKYDILYKINNNQYHSQSYCALSTKYKIGDTLKVYYNPKDLQAAVVLEKDFEP